MTDEQIREALRKHAKNEKLSIDAQDFLRTHGYVEARRVTNMESKGQEYLLTFITGRGKALMDKA
jgi:hypothetical protein